MKEYQILFSSIIVQEFKCMERETVLLRPFPAMLYITSDICCARNQPAQSLQDLWSDMCYTHRSCHVIVQTTLPFTETPRNATQAPNSTVPCCCYFCCGLHFACNWPAFFQLTMKRNMPILLTTNRPSPLACSHRESAVSDPFDSPSGDQACPAGIQAWGAAATVCGRAFQHRTSLCSN